MNRLFQSPAGSSHKRGLAGKTHQTSCIKGRRIGPNRRNHASNHCVPHAEVRLPAADAALAGLPNATPRQPSSPAPGPTQSLAATTAMSCKTTTVVTRPHQPFGRDTNFAASAGLGLSSAHCESGARYSVASLNSVASFTPWVSLPDSSVTPWEPDKPPAPSRIRSKKSRQKMLYR
jgi:hypothetical protein